MLKQLSVLRAACGLAIAAIAVSIFACGRGGGGGQPDDGAVKLFLGRLSVPMFDSISVHVSAADMAGIHVSESSLKDNLKIDGIPAGENRKFEVKIYADSGKLVQKGEALADIIAGESAAIPVPLAALAGFLRLEVPLGIPNSTGIASGKMLLNGAAHSMEFEPGKGVFTSGFLSLNAQYSITVELYDSRGAVLYSGSKTFVLQSFSQTETIQLLASGGIGSSPAGGSAILELQVVSEAPVQMLAELPASAYGFRKPNAYGDLFFTEIYANPSTADGDNAQYLEFYNPTLDTLDISGCRIAEDREASTAAKRTIMPSGLTVSPGYIVMGRSEANTDYKYNTSFALLKTEQTLIFICGDLLLDSLKYSNKSNSDNPFPLVKGTAMQLPLENYLSRRQGSSWCLGFSPRANAVCQ